MDSSTQALAKAAFGVLVNSSSLRYNGEMQKDIPPIFESPIPMDSAERAAFFEEIHKELATASDDMRRQLRRILNKRLLAPYSQEVIKKVRTRFETYITEHTGEEDGEIALSPSEERLLLQVTSEQGALLSAKCVDDMRDHADDIVVTRSDDIFWLLHCVKLGYFPVGKGLRSKTGENTFYTHPNPESQALLENPDLARALSTQKLTFKKMLQENSTTYAESGVFLSTLQSCLAPEVDIYTLGQDFHLYIQDDSPIATHETLLVGLMIMLRRVSKGKDLNENERAVLRFMESRLGLDRQLLLSFYKALEPRRGVVLGFNKNLLRFPVYGPGSKYDEGDIDIVFEVPDGQIPLECLEKFTCLGSFEDEVLSRLEPKS